MIDWGLAERVAGFVAGDAGAGQPADLPAIALDSEQRVVEYTGLRPTEPLPRAEAISRDEWVRTNLATMRPLLDPVAARLGPGLGPLQAAARGAAGVLIAGEVGVVVGYMSRHVLGQYELMLLEPDAPPRLLFVAPNLDEAGAALQADRDELLRWVALHEVTHALQFAAVPWLHDHLSAMVRELLESLEFSIDTSRLLRAPTADDVRGLVEALRSGDLVSLVLGPERRATVDRIQAVMAVIEGYAEHVMDAAGAEALPNLARLRAAFDRRRASRSGVARLLARLLGLELKLRQYRLGKRFCDEVAERAGVAGLNRVWLDPGALPDLQELERPLAWMDRVQVSYVTS